MPQITTGIRSILSNSTIYNSFQSLLGASRGWELFLREDLRVEAGQKVLDIGCGPAVMLANLPENIEYYGFDISADYIATARKNFEHRNAQFFHGLFDEKSLESIPKINVAQCSGVLHHISDVEAEELFALVAKALDVGGRFISVDPCFIDNQNLFSKFLIERDRGQNIRTPEQLRKLAEPHFASVEVRHRNDLLRIPYDHVIMECRP